MTKEQAERLIAAIHTGFFALCCVVFGGLIMHNCAISSVQHVYIEGSNVR